MLIHVAPSQNQGMAVMSLFLRICFGSALVASIVSASYAEDIVLPEPKITVVVQSHLPVPKFLNQVWQKNPGLQSIKTDINTASANLRAMGLPIYNPKLKLEADAVNNSYFDNVYTAGISQTIDWGDKQGARTIVAEYTLMQAKFQYAARRLMLGANVLEALASYHAQQQVVELAKRRTRLLRRFVQQTERRFTSGDIAQDALDQSRLAYSEAIGQQADAEFTLKQIKEKLDALTLLSQKRWPNLPAILPTPKLPSKKSQQWLVNHLPRLQALGAAVLSTQATISVRQADTKPDPSIEFRGGMEGKQGLVGMSLEVPLFIRNDFTAQVRQASYNAEAIAEHRMNEYEVAKAHLSGTINRYQILYDAYVHWQEASKNSLTGGIELLDRLWSAGELSTTDYIIQLKQRVDSQIVGRKLYGEAWKAWFEWLQASALLDQWLELNPIG